MVGEGALETELRKQTRDIKIGDKVIFCGFRDDINNVLSSFDIFVLPSFIERTSNALLEAMTSGCAIICSDIPGNRQLVSNIDVLLVNPNDRDGFRDAIMLLLSNEALRRKLGFNAKTDAGQYDEEIIFPKYLRHYYDLTNSKRQN